MGGKKKYTVIGMGNRFRSDDAVGLVAVDRLRERGLPARVELVECGADEFGMLEYLERGGHVIVIDAVSGGKPPGTISIFDADEVNMISTGADSSLHGFGLADTIALAKSLGMRPEITVVGVEPFSVEPGEHLSAPVASRMPALVRNILDLIGAPAEHSRCK